MTNYQLTQAGTTLANTISAGELDQSLIQVLGQVHSHVFEAMAQLYFKYEVTSEEALEALIKRGLAEKVS